ncbi:hypothetical protein KPH14_012858 [Odynerus spinipes]|uniref:Uncharacterized protein n=1 Tax=Odynerus spinipes TaxID=1348599 RepID=A0AAD9RDY1_9HYME|nr:hypothetical protein KPH14_012858 [Odynerus spinipes]
MATVRRSPHTTRSKSKSHATKITVTAVESDTQNRSSNNSNILNISTEMANENHMREELERLRVENERQRAELMQLRDNSTNMPTRENDTANLVSGLVHSFNTMNIDVKIPKFEDELKINPLDFLDRLDKYFTFRKCSEFEKLLVIENAIEGRGKIWYNANRCNFMNYVTFKEAFEKEFYSVPMQAKIQSQWSARRFDPRKETLQTFFLFQITEARWFLPKLDQYTINYRVVQQLPVRVREALVTIDFSNVSTVTTALAQLDLTYEERENDRRRIVDRNHNRNNYTNNDTARIRGLRMTRYSNGSVNNFRRPMLYDRYSNSSRPQLAMEDRNERIQMTLPNTSVPPPSCHNHYQNESNNNRPHLN